MSALHVVVRPRPSETESALAALNGLIDVVADGVNLTARVGEGPAVDFLVDLSFGLSSALSGKQPRATVPLHTDSDTWELGLEAVGERVLLSVFRQTPSVVVAAFERPLVIAELRQALCNAVDITLRSSSLPGSALLALKTARQGLEDLPSSAPLGPQGRTQLKPSVARGGFRLAAVCSVRRGSDKGKPDQKLERSDLHGILMLGSLQARYLENQVSLEGVQTFLDVERLLLLADEAVSSLAALRPTFRRTELSAARVSLRRGPGDGPVELRIEPPLPAKPFFATIPTETFVDVVATLTTKLTSAICKADPEQLNNLRVTRAASLAMDLLEQLEPEKADETITNPLPDSYRRFVPRLRRASGAWEHGAKMRFLPRWVATMPNLDLRATFLCGDRLVVGGHNETACLERHTGAIAWRKELPKAASVVTPSGLVRIEPDGRLLCHHLDNGEVRFAQRVKPRAHGGATGAVLYGPGLPKLLAITEGDRQVTGIDLVTGEVRWRHTAKRPAPYRVRRAGRLLLVGGGDPLLVALDGATGEVVWSRRSRLPFTGDVALDHDTACTLSGSKGGSWFLHKLNPFSGEVSWDVELDDRPLGRAPLLTPRAIVVPTTDDDSRGAVAFDRETGKKLWEQAPGLIEGTSAWMAVDDCILINGARGIFMGLDANTGSVRFTHVFASSCDADQPRRLEPILRSGALFVPQETVHVVRPLNGDLLGSLPTDLVPDLIRVDERCDVYVAEESGHLAAFGAAPKLAVVR